MPAEQDPDLTVLTDAITRELADKDLASLAGRLASLSVTELVAVCERLQARSRAVVYRLLSKQQAIEVFEELPPALQGDLLQGLQEADVAALFAELDPDDRVWLLDELPAAVAPRLLRNLSEPERERTAEMLGYPEGSVGRRMSPDYLATRRGLTVAETWTRVRSRLEQVETVYTLPVLDEGRRMVGILSLRDLLGADDASPVESVMREAEIATATDQAETVARRCTDLGLLALPIVDSESRLVGILTIDDAVRILEHAESEDTARQGGVEPLRRPYLSTPVASLARSRVVWLLVLAVGATFTVQVLSFFETTLENVTVLALFVPLLIGTGGNTGNQAATTVTRALALNDVRPEDTIRVLTREVRVGLALGLLLGLLGFGLVAVIYQPEIGLVIGLTLVAVCTVAASIGGIMPLVARAIRVDPAVFSNPFISTFTDAAGLILYFLIARAILQI